MSSKKLMIFSTIAMFLCLMIAQLCCAEDDFQALYDEQDLDIQFLFGEKIEEENISERKNADGFVYTIENDERWNKYALICDYPHDETDLVFPSTIERMPVSIPWRTIILDDSVETIVMPDMNVIGSETFVWCSQLKNITFVYGTEKIEHRAAVNCPNLRYIVIPSSVTYIAEDAFEFEKITLEVEAGSYGESFAIEHQIRYTLKQEIIDIGDAALWYDPNELFLVERENGYELLGEFFRTKKVMLPATYLGKDIVKISDFSFSDRGNADVLVIPRSIRTIGGRAFFCSTLKRVYILNGVKKIGSHCFEGCALEFMVIPASVTEIGQDALRGTIYAEPGSYAAIYAQRKGYDYQPIQFAPNYRDEF